MARDLFPAAAIAELRNLVKDPWLTGRQALIVAEHLIAAGEHETAAKVLARFYQETPVPPERRGFWQRRKSVPPLPVPRAKNMKFAHLLVETGRRSAAVEVYRSVLKERRPSSGDVVEAVSALEELQLGRALGSPRSEYWTLPAANTQPTRITRTPRGKLRPSLPDAETST